MIAYRNFCFRRHSTEILLHKTEGADDVGGRSGLLKLCRILTFLYSFWDKRKDICRRVILNGLELYQVCLNWLTVIRSDV